MLILFLFLFGAGLFGQEVALTLADPEPLGSWAQAVQALRLYPTPAHPVRFEGPPLSLRLFGEIALGQARFPFLLGVTPQNEVGLWLDQNRDGRLSPAEELPKTRASAAVLWEVALTAEPRAHAPFPYPLRILWPEGRSYVFLLGGAPRAGEFHGRVLVLVDADLDGVFGTNGDFLGVDVDSDGKIYAEPDGHERFKLSESFTLAGTSFRVGYIPPDGNFLRLEPTEYVPPKVPLIPGAPAPDFSFLNFLDGRELSLAGFRGKVVLLDFWATWCPPCLASLPKLRALYAELQPQGFEIVGVSLDESRDDLRRILTAYEIPWPNAFFGRRWDNPVANLYRVYQVPTTYLLDKRGVIRFRDLQGDELRAAVQNLLTEPAGPEAERPKEPEFSGRLALSLPGPIQLNSRGSTRATLRITNATPYSAQDVTVAWEGLPPGLEAEVPPPFSLPPQKTQELELRFTAEAPDPRAFPREAVLVLTYRLGTGGSASLGVQRIPVALSLAEGAVVREGGVPWWVWGALALGLVLAVWLWGRLGL